MQGLSHAAPHNIFTRARKYIPGFPLPLVILPVYCYSRVGLRLVHSPLSFLFRSHRRWHGKVALVDLSLVSRSYALVRYPPPPHLAISQTSRANRASEQTLYSCGKKA